MDLVAREKGEIEVKAMEVVGPPDASEDNPFAWADDPGDLAPRCEAAAAAPEFGFTPAAVAARNCCVSKARELPARNGLSSRTRSRPPGSPSVVPCVKNGPLCEPTASLRTYFASMNGTNAGLIS